MIEFHNTSITLNADKQRSLSVSLSLTAGDFAVFVGPNGSGKTTLLDVVAGTRKIDSGRIILEPAASPIAYAVQDSSSGLLPWRTILTNILLPAQLIDGNSPLELRDKALSLLSIFNLAGRKDDFPYRLSEGEKQIVNLIRTVCTPSNIVLLDEPFASLNIKSRLVARSMLKEFVRGKTTILVTHDPTDLDWGITRYFRIANDRLIEVSAFEARGFLENAGTEAQS